MQRISENLGIQFIVSNNSFAVLTNLDLAEYPCPDFSLRLYYTATVLEFQH